MSELARVSLGRIVLDVARAAGPSIVLAMLAAVPSCCVVLLPVFLVLSGRTYERIMGLEASRVGRWRLGLAGAPVFFVPLASFFVAASLHGQPEGGAAEWAQVLVALLVSCVLTAVLFPLYAAPFEAIARGSGIVDGWIGSGARAADRGIASTLGHGLLVGALGAAPWAVVPLFGPGARSPWWLFATLAVLASVALTVNLAITARFWSGGAERFGIDRAVTTPRTAPAGGPRTRLASSLVLALAPLGFVAVLVLVALATPSPAWRHEELPSHEPLPAPGVGSPLITGAPSGLLVWSREDDVWLVATSDGGGAGEVRVRGGDETRATLTEETFRGVDGWTLRVPTSRDLVVATFDEDGVRLDDTPADRLAYRLGGALGGAAAALIALVLVVLALAQVRLLGIAASLDRPRFRGVRELAAIEAKLAATEPLGVSGRALHVSGPAHLDLGPLGTVRLPEGAHPLLVPCEPTSLTSGALLTVIATLAPSAGSPFRDGTAPLPPDARLVVGSLEAAQQAFAARTARTNALASLPMIALALVLAAIVFVHL